MREGLVLGKFMPLHNGHLALIDFAIQRCDHLTVLLCHHDKEVISGDQRLLWLSTQFEMDLKVTIQSYQYDPQKLPDSSEPKEDFALRWSNTIKEIVPWVNVIFTSEEYGKNVARCMNIEHQLYDKTRTLVPISASLIRQKPVTYWDFIPATVQPYFIKKIVLLGSESTGKSTLCQRLADHFKTAFVPEIAREIVEQTNECTPNDLKKIATLHADEIINKTRLAQKILFVDTDVIVTKSYSRFLFNEELMVADWIERANHGDIYFFLETDCDYIQDGTRLEFRERNLLSASHKNELKRVGVKYITLNGGWEERFITACLVVDNFIREL